MGGLKRVQAMVSEEEYRLLQEKSLAEKVSVSRLVRETVARYLIAPLERERRLKAVEWIAAGDTPVTDWEEMEAEWERTRYADDDLS